MAAMPRKLPVHVVREITRHKTVKFYFRRGKGPRTRLPDDINSEEFKQAYAGALSGNPAALPSSSPPHESLKWLIGRYMESGAWRMLATASRKQRENIFINAIKRSANVSFIDIDRSTIELSMDDRIDTPAQANNFLKAMRGLFVWALRNKHIEIDPTAGIQKLRYKTDGFPAWTVDDLKSFYARWPIGTKPRLAVELILHSGLRRSDIVTAGRQHLKDRVFSMRPTKTGAEITVEFPDSLIRTIDSTETGDLAFIASEHGRPYTKESFGNWFRDRCNEAGISKSAHGIRKLSATLAANGGAAAHELMAQYGWSGISQAEVYTKGADRKSLGIKSSRRISDQIDAAIPAPEIPVRGKPLKGK